MKNIKNYAVRYLKLFYVLFFSFNAKAVPGEFVCEIISLNIQNNSIINDIHEALKKYQNPPLALFDDPIEIASLINSDSEIIMTPLAGLALLLSHKFEKITLISSDIFELGMHRQIYKHHLFNTQESEHFLKNMINDIFIETDIDENFLLDYFRAFYQKIAQKNLQTEISSKVNDIFNEVSFRNKTIFLSRLLEQELENVDRNLQIIKNWISNDNTVIAVISNYDIYLYFKNKNYFNTEIIKSKLNSKTYYLIIKNN